MSTRCHVVLMDSYENQVWFYRHSDGYPSGVQPTLDKFCEWRNQDRIRDDPMQAAGWLVLLGMQEYATGEYGTPHQDTQLKNLAPGVEGFSGWKIGAYEPTNTCFSDAQYLHVVDMEKGEYRSVGIPDIVAHTNDFTKTIQNYATLIYTDMRQGIKSEHEVTPETEND